MYVSTSHQITPRKRAVGIRPRTFNYYCQYSLRSVPQMALFLNTID
jgi:hypothetical protein